MRPNQNVFGAHVAMNQRTFYFERPPEKAKQLIPDDRMPQRCRLQVWLEPDGMEDRIGRKGCGDCRIARRFRMDGHKFACYLGRCDVDAPGGKLRFPVPEQHRIAIFHHKQCRLRVLARTRGATCGRIPAATSNHRTSYMLLSTGASQFAPTRSFGNAHFKTKIH